MKKSNDEEIASEEMLSGYLVRKLLDIHKRLMPDQRMSVLFSFTKDGGIEMRTVRYSEHELPTPSKLQSLSIYKKLSKTTGKGLENVLSKFFSEAEIEFRPLDYNEVILNFMKNKKVDLKYLVDELNKLISEEVVES